MRFCNNCGYQMGPPPAAAPAPVAPLAAAPLPRSPNPYAAAGAPVCWRCQATGDGGADFCKFCGARYADAPPAQPAAMPKAASSIGSAVASHAYQQSAPAADTRAAIAMLVAILKDGTDGRAYPVRDEVTDIGQKEGAIQLADDPYLSPRHARIISRPDGILVRDLDSVNGVYVRIREPAEIHDGDFLLLGQQVMRFELLPEMELPLGPATQRGAMVFGTPEVPRLARLVQYTTEGVGRDVHYLYRDETVVGREQGDIVCTDDPFMSRRHAALTIDRAAKRFTLRDLGSSNGTAVRIRGERALRPGDQFRVGRHLFRYDRADGARSGA